jgi:hypothetical protein
LFLRHNFLLKQQQLELEYIVQLGREKECEKECEKVGRSNGTTPLKVDRVGAASAKLPRLAHIRKQAQARRLWIGIGAARRKALASADMTDEGEGFDTISGSRSADGLSAASAASAASYMAIGAGPQRCALCT